MACPIPWGGHNKQTPLKTLPRSAMLRRWVKNHRLQRRRHRIGIGVVSYEIGTLGHMHLDFHAPQAPFRLQQCGGSKGRIVKLGGPTGVLGKGCSPPPPARGLVSAVSSPSDVRGKFPAI